MKQFLVYLLICTLLLCAVGCDRSNPSAPTEGNAVFTDYPGVDIRIAGINTGGSDVTLKVLWRNQTVHPVTYGEPYTIERLENGQWVNCVKDTETAFISIGYALNAFDTVYKTYTISDLFDVSIPGTYRFCSSCSVQTGKGSYEPCKVMAEFTLGEQALDTYQEPPQLEFSAGQSAVTVKAAGYHWTYETGNDKAVSTIADQVSRPTPADTTQTLTIDSDNLVQLQWSVPPGSVNCICWQDTVWQNGTAREETISVTDNTFSPTPGSCVYEIVATWEDTGAGFYGSANYYIHILEGQEHSHQTAQEPQTVADPVTGYCGNTWTTLYIGDKEYGFAGGDSVTLTDLLVNLDYDPNKVCRCMPQYRADTEFGKNYHIHLDYGFVRCDQGQAELTREQIDTIAQIVEWAETTNCEYLLID